MNVPSAGSFLDVGTGCGLLALMLAQRVHHRIDGRGQQSAWRIDAIDRDQPSSLQAQQNVAHSRWAPSIVVIAESLGEFRARVQPQREYSLIVCNPPFFRDGPPSPQAARAAARHSSFQFLAELFDFAAAALTDNGKLAMIMPTNACDGLVEAAVEAGLTLSRRTSVHPTPSSPPKRELLELGRDRVACEKSALVIETSRHCYTKEFQELTQAFLSAEDVSELSSAHSESVSHPLTTARRLSTTRRLLSRLGASPG